MLDITKPDNPADTVINLTISGNRLVSVLNALQQKMFADNNAAFADGNNMSFSSSWYAELWETVERIRDQLSEQRYNGNRNLTDK